MKGVKQTMSPHLPPDNSEKVEDESSETKPAWNADTLRGDYAEVLGDPTADDFDSPNVAPGSDAAAELSEQPAPEEEQPELPGTEIAEPEEPKPIRNGKMISEFVRPIFRMDSDGERYVGFEFSMTLTPNHEENGHLPSEVLKEWQHVRDGNVKRTEVKSIGEQTIAIGLVPDAPDKDIYLVGAFIEHPVLAEVEEKGKGAATKVIRFSFRAYLLQTPKHAKFATDHYGDPVWISLQRTQGSLLEP